MAAGGGGAVEQLMAAQMVQAAKVVEERLDEEMDRLENLNDEELDKVTVCSVINQGACRKSQGWQCLGFCTAKRLPMIMNELCTIQNISKLWI